MMSLKGMQSRDGEPPQARGTCSVHQKWSSAEFPSKLNASHGASELRAPQHINLGTTDMQHVFVVFLICLNILCAHKCYSQHCAIAGSANSFWKGKIINILGSVRPGVFVQEFHCQSGDSTWIQQARRKVAAFQNALFMGSGICVLCSFHMWWNVLLLIVF